MEGEVIVYKDCEMLPDLFHFPGWNDYPKYEDMLYEEYLKEIKGTNFFYNGKPVSFKRIPEYNNRDEAFYHIICKKQELPDGTIKFDPNQQRSQRLLWPKAIIENEPCPHSCCDGIYKWTEKNPISKHDRTLLYLKKI